MDTRELDTIFAGTVYLVYRPAKLLKQRRNQDFLSAKSLETGVFIKEDTFSREWKTEYDGTEAYRFRLETYSTARRGWVLYRTRYTEQSIACGNYNTNQKPSCLNEKLEMRNQFEWNLMVLRVGKPRTKKCNSRRWLHIQARQAKSLEDGMRTGLRSLLTAWSSQQAILSMLDFDDVLYMLECNINYLHDYNRYDEFMDLLARQKKEVVYHKGGAKEAT
ncbi:2077_t:CDS:2 [Paraglomus brasilianum]|uniref:2077_t:CDS:1 n=1 Tax=Paraglomus brasilianum TaxID=144538 RepID=A0A9N8Z6V1_9GLOM|nr:2077_t:CDS:2 [Paraglomus brasilianum]